MYDLYIIPNVCDCELCDGRTFGLTVPEQDIQKLIECPDGVWKTFSTGGRKPTLLVYNSATVELLFRSGLCARDISDKHFSKPMKKLKNNRVEFPMYSISCHTPVPAQCNIVVDGISGVLVLQSIIEDKPLRMRNLRRRHEW